MSFSLNDFIENIAEFAQKSFGNAQASKNLRVIPEISFIFDKNDQFRSENVELFWLGIKGAQRTWSPKGQAQDFGYSYP